jgi:hypothetical protein
MMPCSSLVPLRCVLATLVAAALATSCGSRPGPGLWDGSFGTGSCGAGSNGQFTCTPDRGSWPADCAAEERGLALFPLGDFTKENAAKFYVYTDKSGQGRVSSFDRGWEPSTVADPFPRCADGSAPRALHIQGGPFYGWGGGVGTSAKDWSGFPAPSDLPGYLSAAAIDASGYEGVALWARRGPDSQGGVRVLVGDIDTDDDISYLTYVEDPAIKRNCERVRECACTNHKTCQRWDTAPLDMTTPNLKAWSEAVNAENLDRQYQMWSCASAGSYCEDPSADTVPGYFTTGGMTTRCNTCAQTRCDERYEAYPDQSVGDAKADAQFYRKPCTPYTFRSGISSAFCFDPGKDPPPAEQDEQCGDHWTSPIYLTDQWRLYLVPFSEMLQQGWAKRFAKMDTRHVTLVRLTWDGGYIDYWVGWIGFYRRAG